MIDFEFALDQFELYILILMRITAFVYAAPFFNQSGIPHRTKIGFSLCLSMLIYSMVFESMNVSYSGVFEFVLVVIKELSVGLLLGLMTTACVQIILFAGKIIDMDVGISMAQIYDPTTRMNNGILGNFYYYILWLLLIISGLYRYLVAAIVETYNVIDIGGVSFSTTLFTDVVGFMGDYFIIGFRIAIPIFAVTLLTNCVLAILAKVAPQMNMFVIGIQLKICIGVTVVYFTIVMMPTVSNFILDEIEAVFASLVRGMS